ncbi:MAG TPA: hypothetical protein VGO05_09180, partial [Roseiarcus sp.]|nr:hypothetical protein [Roseiarcus sp.]
MDVEPNGAAEGSIKIAALKPRLRRSRLTLMICSTALRAQQTLDPIIKGAKMPPKIVLKRELYGGTQQLWEQLWILPESAKSVLLIGHNPARTPAGIIACDPTFISCSMLASNCSPDPIQKVP